MANSLSRASRDLYLSRGGISARPLQAKIPDKPRAQQQGSTRGTYAGLSGNAFAGGVYYQEDRNLIRSLIAMVLALPDGSRQ